MGSKFFEELSRYLGKEQIESLSKEDRRLEIFLHGQPVLSVSPGNEVFMLPSGSKNPEANELYHRVAIAADRVFEYVEAIRSGNRVSNRPSKCERRRPQCHQGIYGRGLFYTGASGAL